MIIIVINIMILVNITQTNHRFLNHIKVGDNSEIHLKFWLERFWRKDKKKKLGPLPHMVGWRERGRKMEHELCFSFLSFGRRENAGEEKWSYLGFSTGTLQCFFFFPSLKLLSYKFYFLHHYYFFSLCVYWSNINNFYN